MRAGRHKPVPCPFNRIPYTVYPVPLTLYRIPYTFNHIPFNFLTGDIMDQENIAETLAEVLPNIRRLSGKTIVIKYGGHAMVDEQLKEDFARDITLMKYIGLNPVVVHGGGPQINSALKQMGIQSRFVRGMRVTDDQTMEVVEMVLAGTVNKSIVARINRAGANAIGLCGKDAQLICAEKIHILYQEDQNKPPEVIDAGLVGQVTRINSGVIHSLTEHDFVPVIAPIGIGDQGETYNINADLVASEIAMALSAGRLIYLTDVDGVLDSSGSLISTIDSSTIHNMVEDGTISGGMIPKIEYALKSLNSGVEKVHIINGTKRHALLMELFTEEGIGTEVTL